MRAFVFGRRCFSSYPGGFRVAGVQAGLKKRGGLDMTLVASDFPCTAAGVFTQNAFAAAPVTVSKQQLKNHGSDVHGVIINSGCANACTGDQGVRDAHMMADICAEHGVPNPLIMSTGVIGPFLRMDIIRNGISMAARELGNTQAHWDRASQGIMTTDTVPKLFSKKYDGYSMAGMCKGAGMIHPNMATMLGVMVTDCAISPECLQAALGHSVQRSFNAISVDGDTSTNDTVVVLANGQAGGAVIDDVTSQAFHEFRTNLTDTATELAKRLVKDGEGATKFTTIRVSGARTYESAHKVASSIATSALVKTALFGEDANWGRILCATGYSGVPMDPAKVSLWFRDEDNSEVGDLQLVRDGRPHNTDEEKATALLTRPNITIHVDLGLGSEEATYWTCDFSYDYVKINADYRS